MDLKKLVNKGIDGLSPYEPGKPIEDLERELGIKTVSYTHLTLPTTCCV